ncbi:hypothetical protein Ddye_003588 [Dipteronia dyeriana]|uniref:Uncharacterized protein n=1 Tax=Dipteronia dyeriana TaxID=168575 RepID=A0AAD9XSJ5_9ROSI|nr:hypothetical protein Ddye_003588 [Dipteronia dyeriana]
MARLFARHGVKATIISTPLNTPFISRKIEKDRQLREDIGVRVINAFDCIRSYEPHRKVTSDLEPFTIPGLPDHVKLKRLQLPNFIRDADKNEIAKLLDQSHKAELTSYGVIINSFHELEPAYTEHFRKVMGRKAWHIGPISLSNRYKEDNDQGANNTASVDGQECLRWLDAKKPKSVLYVGFGSVFRFSAAQLLEIARGLEASGQHFMWVQINNEDKGEWMPEGFEERMQRKAVVGFLTHCEWNSILESIAAGVPMATWPLYGEQFFNEKLVTDVLRIGVGVGAQEWSRWIDEK